MKGRTAMSDSSSYSSRQRARDDDYRRQYEQWVATLPEEERQKLEALGVDAPSLPGPSGGTLRDAATSSRARCEDEFNDEDESNEPPDEPEAAEHSAPDSAPNAASSPCSNGPQPADGEHLHDILRRLVGELIGQDNSNLSVHCLALVTGLTYEGNSMTAIAEQHGVTRAAVSKRCVELTQALNLKPSRAMRSLLARKSYRTARTLNLRSTA
jgi:hypothetical protein